MYPKNLKRVSNTNPSAASLCESPIFRLRFMVAVVNSKPVSQAEPMARHHAVRQGR
jgi:hypothetical protein